MNLRLRRSQLWSAASLACLAGCYQPTILPSTGYTQAGIAKAHGNDRVGWGGPDIFNTRALLWSDLTSEPADVTPDGYAIGTVNGTDGRHQVGYAQVTALGGGDSFKHAIVWTGSAASATDITPPAFPSAQANGVSGEWIAGYGNADGGDFFGGSHALLWLHGRHYGALDLNPPGFTWSQANGTGLVHQVGAGGHSSEEQHAIVWAQEAATAIDLHPNGYARSAALAVDDAVGAQVGVGETLGDRLMTHALLWHGTASSAVDLTPTGYIYCIAEDVYGDTEVGYGGDANGTYHGLVWQGTADSAIDLDRFLPQGYSQSAAYGIDERGNVVGAVLDANKNWHPIVWTPVPAPMMTAIPLVIVGPIYVPAVRGGR